jgi:hypothetical protein
MATGQIDRKPDPRKNVVGLNLAPAPEPVGFGCPSGSINGFLSGGRVSFRGVRVLSFFGFWGFLFLSVSDFFRFLSGFGYFRVHPRLKNETCTQIQFCAGRVRITGAKMHLNPHSSGAKPTGYPKLEPKLPSILLLDFIPKLNLGTFLLFLNLG